MTGIVKHSWNFGGSNLVVRGRNGCGNRMAHIGKYTQKRRCAYDGNEQNYDGTELHLFGTEKKVLIITFPNF